MNDAKMLDALYSFLKSEDWQEYVTSFVKSNCHQFPPSSPPSSSFSDEFSHEQFATWKNFQEIAEQVLEGALSEMHGIDFGGGMAALEAELDRISLEEPTGPRDSAMKEILGQLLTFDSFPNFAIMMQDAAVATDGNYSSPKHTQVSKGPNGSCCDHFEKEEILLKMGFPSELVGIVLESAESDTPIDALVSMLSEMASGKEESASKLSAGTVSVDNNAFVRLFAKAIRASTRDLISHINTARSIVETLQHNMQSSAESNSIKWAIEFCSLIKEAESCYEYHCMMDDTRNINESRIFEQWKVNLPHLTDNVSLVKWFDMIMENKTYTDGAAGDDMNDMEDEDDLAYIECFSAAVDVPATDMISRLIDARSILNATNASQSGMIRWAEKFCAMMKEAETCFVFKKLSSNSSLADKRIFDEWIVDIPHKISSISVSNWYKELEREHALEENHAAFMSALASVLGLRTSELQSKLDLAQSVYQSMVEGTQAAAERKQLCVWAIDFLDLMKAAQDIYHSSCKSGKRIPPNVFLKTCTDSNGVERTLVDWYNELETLHSEEEDESGCIHSLANALQTSPFELKTKLNAANDICQSVKSNDIEFIGNAKGVRLGNWAEGFKSFLKESQTCYLHYQLSNSGGPVAIMPPHVFGEWKVDVYTANNVSVNSHGDDATKSRQSRGLLQWYSELEFARLQAQSSANDAEDDVAFKDEADRLAELEKIAAMGTENEHLLHTLITRHDSATKELGSYHSQCDLLCSVASGGVVRREKLEEMYLYLKQNIQSEVGDLEDVSAKVYDKMQDLGLANESSGVVDTLLGMHLLEDELIILKGRIESILNTPAGDIGSKLAGDEEHKSFIGETVCSSDPPSPFRRGDKWSREADAKHADHEAMLCRENKDDPSAKEISIDNSAAMEFTNRLKESHRTGLAKLKAALSAERARQIGKLKEKRNRAHRKGEPTQDIDDSIHALSEELNEEEENLIKGYKRRCVLETRMVKAKIASGAPAKQWSLTPSEREEAGRDAAKSLRDKYESELKKLLQAQMHNRSRAKQSMMDKILARKRKNAARDNFASSETAEEMVDAADEEATLQLKAEEVMQQAALVRPLLLSVAAAEMMDPTAVQLEDLERKDDDDGYFGENTEDDSKSLELFSKWANASVGMSNSYLGATKLLQDSLPSSDRMSGASDAVLNAFTRHCQELGNDDNIVQWSRRSGMDSERVKEGILKEFERKKTALENCLAHQRDASSKLLDKRRKNKKKSSLEYETEDDTVEVTDVDHVEELIRVMESQPADSFETRYKAWSSEHSQEKSNDSVSNPTGDTGSQQSTQFVVKRGYHLPPLGQAEQDSNKMFLSEGDAASRVEVWMQQRRQDSTKKDSLLDAHKAHQGNLIEGLKTEMARKKQKLKARLNDLKSKRKQNDSQSDEKDIKVDTSDQVEAEAEAEAEAEEDHLQRLEQNYEKLMSMLKSSNVDDLERVGLSRLRTLLDNESLGDSLVQEAEKDQMVLSDFEAWDEIEKRRQEMKSSQQNQRSMLQAQAKEISNQFSEENKKLSLKMNIEKARQKQNLQRKLLQRKKLTMTKETGSKHSWNDEK